MIKPEYEKTRCNKCGGHLLVDRSIYKNHTTYVCGSCKAESETIKNIICAIRIVREQNRSIDIFYGDSRKSCVNIYMDGIFDEPHLIGMVSREIYDTNILNVVLENAVDFISPSL